MVIRGTGQLLIQLVFHTKVNLSVSNLSATRVTTLVKNNQLVFAVYIASSIEISSVYDDRHIPVFI